MKIIDILISISKNEQMPHIIEYLLNNYTYNYKDKEYYRSPFEKEYELYDKIGLFSDDLSGGELTDVLNEEIKIIEM